MNVTNITICNVLDINFSKNTVKVQLDKEIKEVSFAYFGLQSDLTVGTEESPNYTAAVILQGNVPAFALVFPKKSVMRDLSVRDFKCCIMT
jgi:hypothetical protein